MATHEQIPHSPEQSLNPGELESVAQRRRAELEAHREAEPRGHEASREQLERSARHEIERATAEKESTASEKAVETKQPRTHTKNDRQVAYSRIMTTTRAQMSAPSRTFSKVIHTPVVERASEVIGTTIARPNAVLSGAVFAFIFTLVVYLIGKWFGYPLSGFETIFAFILGWVAGLLYDFLKVMITGKKA